MGEAFAALGIGAWKPLLTVLLLPPVPLLGLIAVGAWRRGNGRWLVAFGIAGVWLSSCSGCGRWLIDTVLHPPPALGAQAIASLAAHTRDRAASAATTIVVLGGGREADAPEYGQPDLRPPTLMRLRYGLWLARRTGAPVAFSGGTGWSQPDGVSEADIAARVAATEFGRTLAWTESVSRDTRGNAAHAVAALRAASATQAVIVTHAWHMPRALRLFEAAAQGSIGFIAAPVGLGRGDRAVFDWLPTSDGHELVRNAAREILARAVGD